MLLPIATRRLMSGSAKCYRCSPRRPLCRNTKQLQNSLVLALVQVKESGWLAQHVLVRHEETKELLGCCPMYLKGHSYGEYVVSAQTVLSAAWR
jgi:hypothetical protein